LKYALKSSRIEKFDYEMIVTMERTHYELMPFRKLMRIKEIDSYKEEILRYKLGNIIFKNSKTFLLIQYDIHHNLSSGFEITDIWNNPYPLNIHRIKMLGQSPEDMIWFYSARLYHQTMVFNITKLRMFCDVLSILNTYKSKINWKHILEVAKKYTLQPCLYYVLSHCRKFLPQTLPDYLLTELNPENSNIMGYHDWGDFTAKMFKKAVLLDWDLS
jgi:hypothetical protein